MSERINRELYSTFKELISEAIQAYAAENHQANMASVPAQEQLTLHISKHLHGLITGCEDEIDSLWFMLDESKASESAIKSLDFKGRVDKMVDDHVVLLKMMQRSKGDA